MFLMRCSVVLDNKITLNRQAIYVCRLTNDSETQS